VVSSKDAEPFHEGSGRLAILADEHPAVSRELMTTSESIRDAPTFLEVWKC
jgi:hypothetical protein